MAAKTVAKAQPEFSRSAAGIFAVNERINQMLIAALEPAAWNAKLPGKVRSIAAIFSHMHNVRCKWVRLTAPHVKMPAQLNRARCTPKQASAALAASASGCIQMLEDALGGSCRIQQFRRDGWAKPWPVGPEMLSYMLVHEAHHRGQICMLAHQLGFPLPSAVTAKMWNWEKIWSADTPLVPGDDADQ
jgi:uncharacterized damage-inducible protein DinB